MLDNKHTNRAKEREKYGVLAGVVGIFTNFLLFLLKLFIGIVTNSVSIMADAFNNLSDGASSIVSILGFKLSGKAADAKHPFGYGRTEYLAGLFIAVMILMVGFSFVKTSIVKIFNPAPIEFSYILLFILIISILAKIFLGLFNYKLGIKINSTVLKAVMQDSINDCISTGLVALAMIIEEFSGYKIDGYIGLLVAIFIIYSGINLIKDTISPLIGQSADPKISQKIKDTIMGFDHIIGVHDLIIHNYGEGKSLASIHVEVPDTIDFTLIHNIVDDAEKAVWQETAVYIVIHMDPVCTTDSKILDIKEKVLEKTDGYCIHDFRIVENGNITNIIFDVIVPFGFTKVQKENFTKSIQSIDENYNPIISFDTEM